MAVKIPDEGQIALNKFITQLGGVTLRFILFKNNVAVTNASVYANLTEADFSGYMNAASTWGAPFTNGSDQSESDGSTVTFTRAVGLTSNTIYGWAIVAPLLSGTVIVACDNITPAKPMNNPGDGISLTPKFRLYRE